jgi:hypothetical protein
MLIGFYRKSYLFQYVFLVLITGILWISTFLVQGGQIPGTDPLLQPAYALILKIIGYNDFIGKIIALALVITQAFLFNQILIQHDLVPKNTLLPALVFLILISHSEQLLHLGPALISTFILLFVLHLLFQVYTEEEAYSQIFNAGFLVAISSFIYYPSVFFILFIWLTFIVFRLYKWREWLIPLIGAGIPYIFLLTYYFWTDSLIPALEAYLNYFGSLFPPRFSFKLELMDYIISGMIAFLFLWSLLRTATEIQEKNIGVRKRFWSVFWFLFIAMIIFVFEDLQDTSHLVLLTIPLTIYIARGLSQVKKKKWVEVVFWILLLLIAYNNLKGVLFI